MVAPHFCGKITFCFIKVKGFFGVQFLEYQHSCMVCRVGWCLFGSIPYLSAVCLVSEVSGLCLLIFVTSEHSLLWFTSICVASLCWCLMSQSKILVMFGRFPVVFLGWTTNWATALLTSIRKYDVVRASAFFCSLHIPHEPLLATMKTLAEFLDVPLLYKCIFSCGTLYLFVFEHLATHLLCTYARLWKNVSNRYNA